MSRCVSFKLGEWKGETGVLSGGPVAEQNGSALTLWNKPINSGSPAGFFASGDRAAKSCIDHAHSRVRQRLRKILFNDSQYSPIGFSYI